MLIVCPSCATSYDVELTSLGPKGRPVRCLRCRMVWYAAPSRAEKLAAAAAAIAPARAVARPAAEVHAGSPVLGGWTSDEVANEKAWLNSSTDELPENQNPPILSGSAPSDHASATAEDELSFDGSDQSGDLEAPPIAPVDLDEGQAPVDISADHFADHSAERQQDIETVAARRQRRRPTHGSARWPLSRLQSGILALLIVDAILVGWRSDFVRILPQTASFYAALGLPVNLRGLAFDGITSSAEQHEGVPILVVEGTIVNNTGRVVEVPRLKLVVRNAAHQEIYSWTTVPTRTVLPQGEAVPFRTRLASPPPDGRDVVVRFVNRRDMIVGVH